MTDYPHWSRSGTTPFAEVVRIAPEGPGDAKPCRAKKAPYVVWAQRGNSWELLRLKAILGPAMEPVSLTPADRLLAGIDQARRALSSPPRAARAKPLPAASDAPLGDAERREAGALMRVNHVGEVCAQALYSAQALATPNPALRRQFAEAAQPQTLSLRDSARSGS